MGSIILQGCANPIEAGALIKAHTISLAASLTGMADTTDGGSASWAGSNNFSWSRVALPAGMYIEDEEGDPGNPFPALANNKWYGYLEGCCGLPEFDLGPLPAPNYRINSGYNGYYLGSYTFTYADSSGSGDSETLYYGFTLNINTRLQNGEVQGQVFIGVGGGFGSPFYVSSDWVSLTSLLTSGATLTYSGNQYISDGTFPFTFTFDVSFGS